MNRVQVFEPALCCATGVCGEDVDQRLVTFSADLDFVRSQGGDVTRYNLASEPLVFAETAAVRGFLQVVGSRGLPLVLVDGLTAMTGGYPDRARLAEWAGLSEPVAVAAVPAPAGATMLGLAAAAPTAGACCSSSETGGCCSSHTGSETAGCCSSSTGSGSGSTGSGSTGTGSTSSETAGCC
jgi:arsenite-transporting ATPase